MEADLLLHVLDASSPNVGVQREAVYKVLKQLGIAESKLKTQLVEVWNKSDLIETVQDIEDSSLSASFDNSGAVAMNDKEAKQEGEDELPNQASIRTEDSRQDKGSLEASSSKATAVEPRSIALDRRKGGNNKVAAQQDAIWELIKVGCFKMSWASNASVIALPNPFYKDSLSNQRHLSCSKLEQKGDKGGLNPTFTQENSSKQP